jgi:copper chaperone NosL
MTARLLPILLLLVAAGCKPSDQHAAAPPPQAMTADAVAQFCGMDLSEHPGAKGQLFVQGDGKPIWFASVRDAVAFTLLPEMPKTIAAVYVTDMTAASAWKHPEAAPWIDARKASYVIGSHRRSGMDTAEAVPFGDAAAAQRFAAENGGKVVGFAAIPRDYVLGSDRS